MKIVIKQMLMPLLFLAVQLSSAQNIGIGTATPHTSAKLDVQSQNSGVLLPRMSSAQRKAISNPAKGLLVFDTDTNAFMYWNGTEWQMLVPGNASGGMPTEIMNPGSSAVNNFGYEVAISGNFAAVAALHSSNINRPVYIYEKTTEGWLQRQEITCPDAGGTFFGNSLDMDGDYLVIGDYFWKNANSTSVGKVFIFKRTNGIYTYENGIQSVSASQDYFAYDVAVSQSTPDGPVVAVGMPHYSATIPARFWSGRVLLYKKVNNNWVLAQNILPTQMLAGDQTGFSVDINGSILVVGAPYRETNSGGVYIYELAAAGSSWQQTGSYLGGGANDMLFGYSVSASNNFVAAGMPAFTTGKKGKVVLFKKLTTNNWTPTWLNEPSHFSGETSNSFFGQSVSLSGDYLLVAAPSSNFTLGSTHKYGMETGRAVLYKLRLVAGVIPVSLLKVSEAEFASPDNSFAKAVGISGGNVIIGHQHAADESSAIKGSVTFSSYDE
ncbi:MAG TPA: FG-GAP repeat protein [Ferruginibacter sp.]|nr:FG-GAP repeat protein [Ferruginibacter sp.]HRE63784.1 FG-GAP repeat protein [Ferruginibacter sp.]